MTVDEELNLLDEGLRRLKVEYDVYFGGGAKLPPGDTEWRVKNLLKKFSDGRSMGYAQRFRYNAIAQKYAVFSDLWRQKMKIKEEGYRRPADALLSIQGVRTAEEHAAQEALETGSIRPLAYHARVSDVDSDEGVVRELYDSMTAARQAAGELLKEGANYESFRDFVRRKTTQIRQDYGCHSVEYSVELQDGRVRLKAKPKV